MTFLFFMHISKQNVQTNIKNKEVVPLSVLDNFSTWKEFLADKIDKAKDYGMSNDTITNLAQHVGDYLSQHVEPENKEERVLLELWNAASEEEQRAIASTMVKLVQKGK